MDPRSFHRAQSTITRVRRWQVRGGLSVQTQERVSPRTWRPVIMGRGGAVASNHPVATRAGYDVLRAGGNAADAAVAVASTLGVVEPYMSGLGGDAFYLYYDAGARKASVINASGAAPGST